MRRLSMICVAALSLAACTPATVADGLGGIPAAPPTPLAGIAMDDQAVAFAFEAADAAASLVDAAVLAGKLVPGTPKARQVAGYLRALKGFINAASSAQRLGQSASYREAFDNAKATLAQIRAAVR